MPKGRGAQHRHRTPRQKSAVGCYSSNGANHCTGLHPVGVHSGPKNKYTDTHTSSQPSSSGFFNRSWWMRFKEWLIDKTDDVAYAVSPRLMEKRISKRIENHKTERGKPQTERGQTIQRRKI